MADIPRSGQDRGRGRGMPPPPGALGRSQPPPSGPPGRSQPPPSGAPGRGQPPPPGGVGRGNPPPPPPSRGHAQLPVGRGEGDKTDHGGLPRAMGAMRLADSEPRGFGRGSTRGVGVHRIENHFDLVKTRPGSVQSKQGKEGKPIQLLTNYFGFATQPDFCLWQYRVDLSLEEDRTFVRKAILQGCRKMLPSYLFDGTMLFTTKPVFDAGRVQELRLTSAREDREAGTKEPCEVIIRNANKLLPTDLHYLQFYNIVLRRTMEKMDLKLLGRNYFDPKNVQRIPEYNLEVWPGYVTSIRQHEREVLLCAEVANKVIRTDTVLQHMKINKNKKVDFSSGVLGAIIMTRYNEKTYRVDSVDTSRNPLSTFMMSDGSTMSFVDYYRKRYQVPIRDMTQPLLVSLPKERDRRGGRNEQVMLVPELCYMTGLTDEMRSDNKRMTALSVHTRVAPASRVAALEKFARTLTGNEACQAALNEWGLSMHAQLQKVQGRVLRPEAIHMKRPIQTDRNPGDWTRGFNPGAASGGGLFMPVPIRNWICVYPKQEEGRMKAFWKAMEEASLPLGLQVEEPTWVQVTRHQLPDEYVQAIRNKHPNFVMVVIPNEKDNLYKTCKRFLCIEQPIPSQFITVSKVLSKEMKHKQVATKVLIQMTTKLGGVPWKVQPLPPDSMVVGFDTYHDASRKSNSVGALVASINPDFTRYVSFANAHLPKQEISNSISALMSEALRKYKEVNGGNLPGRIFFYRDGVGDGQLQEVYEIELESMKAMFGQFQKGYNPKLAYIIVSKRINSRFFHETRGQNGRDFLNPPCGTIVDDVATLPERYDFFLIPQTVRQGTVNPTSFNVIYDSVGLPPDLLQQLTYRMCHLYYNWSGTVRVPAPCQYAHKLAYLMGESLNATPSPHLADLLFYL